jgi:hypothetical protein
MFNACLSEFIMFYYMGIKVKLDPIERERNSVPGAGSYNPSIDFA